MEQTKKLTAISLFSGAGGMDIGFRNAGFKISVAVEQDPSCCNTLRKNCPQLPIIEDDITEISSDTILNAAKLKVLEPDLVIGGPPCQPFSLAGNRMGLEDSRGKLVLEFIRVVKETLPKAFVIENVKGMVNWSNGNALKAIMNELNEPICFKNKLYSYKADFKVLNAADFGVPQFRERVFVVGNRLDKPFSFPEPTHCDDSSSLSLFSKRLLPHKTVWEAIGSLPQADEPSDMAKRISETIKGRIQKHGY